ncbi:MAG: 2'-5' RNA ligase family protein [Methanoregula sp.]|nr:MAG: 2'-5' RNA ligase family protein [Methanoregula sp.]
MGITFPDNMFLIEIRLGRTKWRVKRITAKIIRKFSIEEFAEKHPHITLFGPFTLKDRFSVQDLLGAVESAAKPFGAIPFLVHGYDTNQGLNGAVIAYKVTPTPPLEDLTEAVARSVRNLADTLNTWDQDPGQKWFHVTIANRLDRQRAAEIFEYLENTSSLVFPPSEKSPGLFRHQLIRQGVSNEDFTEVPVNAPLYDEEGLRITVVRGGNILAEYDLIQHRWFFPDDPYGNRTWKQTLQEHRKKSGLELTRPRYSKDPDIFVISDLHFGHSNIIRYCARPFPHDAVDDMDQMLIKNWNCMVKPVDRIFHIGDLCYGEYAKSPSEYLERLNGDITLIEGNHDGKNNHAYLFRTLVHLDIPFLLIHNPDDVAGSFSGWVIHGHHHNNNLAEYPFVNFEKRRINVSAEVIGYRPVSLSRLCTIIQDHKSNPAIRSILLRGE